jgi:hypothetical protein
MEGLEFNSGAPEFKFRALEFNSGGPKFNSGGLQFNLGGPEFNSGGLEFNSDAPNSRLRAQIGAVEADGIQRWDSARLANARGLVTGLGANVTTRLPLCAAALLLLCYSKSMFPERRLGMKRVLGFAVLALLVALAVQAAPIPAGNTSATPLAEQLGLTTPQVGMPVFMTGCEVSLDCVCGGGTVTISCSGTTCSVQERSVTCDGHRHPCPPIGSCPP